MRFEIALTRNNQHSFRVTNTPEFVMSDDWMLASEQSSVPHSRTAEQTTKKGAAKLGQKNTKQSGRKAGQRTK